jgi:hypothetical protein
MKATMFLNTIPYILLESTKFLCPETEAASAPEKLVTKQGSLLQA